jgi:hypothetical protein
VIPQLALPDLYVLADARDAVARVVLAEAARRRLRARMCSLREFAAALTVTVDRTGPRVTPDRPVLIRPHAGGGPPGPDAAFIADEVHAHAMGGLSLCASNVVNRPRVRGIPVLTPPVRAQYHLRGTGALPAGITLGDELFRDRVRGAAGWEVQDIYTRETRLGDADTISETPQRLRRRDSGRPAYLSVLVVGTRTWITAGDSEQAGAARQASTCIAGASQLQLAEITFRPAGPDGLEVVRVDANPPCFPESLAAEAAGILLDLLLGS